MRNCCKCSSAGLGHRRRSCDDGKQRLERLHQLGKREPSVPLSLQRPPERKPEQAGRRGQPDDPPALHRNPSLSVEEEG